MAVLRRVLTLELLERQCSFISPFADSPKCDDSNFDVALVFNVKIVTGLYWSCGFLSLGSHVVGRVLKKGDRIGAQLEFL